ncbi:hypothetical protein E5D57_004996 [Metarhizium anisopliae]|nr:hypothetical protein E5D57_004996 [Metarhizium anisopliae]
MGSNGGTSPEQQETRTESESESGPEAGDRAAGQDRPGLSTLREFYMAEHNSVTLCRVPTPYALYQTALDTPRG